ncbi:MAG TPA: hypothetical protein VHR45_15470 [Thermoanaerobaculia bacterium]|nr:hypothetical protein [Thermoanaerobaculia bacterium]
MAAGVHPLVAEVLSGTNRELLELAARGLLPLPPEQLIPLQVRFARGPDRDLARRASESLKSMDPRVAAPFLARQATPQELSFFAAEVSHPLIVETILQRRDVPRPLLVDLARRLPGDLQEVLLLRQDAILEKPEILSALAGNRQVTPYSLRRIAEYREHLLPRAQAAGERRGLAAQAAAAGHAVAEETLSEEELASQIEAVRKLSLVPDSSTSGAAAESESSEVEEKTGLTEGQIRMLPVPSRIRLSRGASRFMKNVLLRDTNAQVAIAVINHNNFAEQEMEQVARSRLVLEAVLEEIAKKREWVGRYSVCKALVQNPKTPISVSVRLLPRLSPRDLRATGRDRNVPDAVRSNALRLYTIKQK